MTTTASSLRTRSGSVEDQHRVGELWRLCGLTVDYNDPLADYCFALTHDCSDVLLGEDVSGALIASVMVGHDGHRGWLYYASVHPRHRGLGYGRCMVVAAEMWLRDRGIKKVQLLVRSTNPSVVSFYENVGFAVTPRTVMGKWLQSEPGILSPT